jgi:hypothetical protein
MTNNKTSRQNILRTTALTTLLVGTIGSLYFMFNAGSNQKSIVLIGLFTAWVLSPFIGLFVADRLSKHRSDKIHSLNYWTMLILSVASLTVYSGALTPSQTRPAFNFLVVPLLSWLTILAILFISKRQHLKQKQ